ncbi:MAG TPA: HdeD family acid-resistance protein [Rugosimonospora sp.]|nr:HdeD family acid-resistance protein [Rugosimonospora sp.]
MSFAADPTGTTPANQPSNTGVLGMLGSAAWQTLLVAGAAAIVLGVVALAWTGATLVVAGTVFGIYLLLSGVFQLAGAFATHLPGHLRVLGLVSGSLSVLLGLICFRGPAQSILLLALWIGFGWLLRGIMTTAMAVSSPVVPARGWQALLGGITIIAGIVLIVSPFASIATLTVVAGVWLIALGAIEIVHGIRLRAHLARLG